MDATQKKIYENNPDPPMKKVSYVSFHDNLSFTHIINQVNPTFVVVHDFMILHTSFGI